MSISLAITFLVILIKQSTRCTISSLFAYESLTTTRQKRNCMEKHPLVSHAIVASHDWTFRSLFQKFY